MDISQREGKYPVPPGASQILGVEFSGHVDELGSGVSEWKTGDEVFGLTTGVCVQLEIKHFSQDNRILCQIQGAYAEYIVVSEKELLPKPTHLSWVDAASIPEVWITGTWYSLLQSSSVRSL